MQASKTDTRARLFLGLPVSDRAVNIIQKKLHTYNDHIERTIPRERWHVTLIFLGEVERLQQYIPHVSKPLPQEYLPTVTVTYLGRGLNHHQLWAYINPTPVLQHIRAEFIQRLRSVSFPIPSKSLQGEYVPHINVAKLCSTSKSSATSRSVRKVAPGKGIGLADEPISFTFAAHEAHLYRSHYILNGVKYTKEVTIPLHA